MRKKEREIDILIAIILISKLIKEKHISILKSNTQSDCRVLL